MPSPKSRCSHRSTCRVRGFFFQPPPDDGSVASPVERLAQELGLEHSRLTISGRPGHRTVFASSAGLHHTLATELSAITFASNADLIQRWVNVLQFRIDRDWIWDGLAEAGARRPWRVVKRPEQGRPRPAGRDHPAVPRRCRSQPTIRRGANVRAPERQFTDVFFFDAFDPKPAPANFPRKSRSNTGSCRRSKATYPRPHPRRCRNCSCPVTTPAHADAQARLGRNRPVEVRVGRRLFLHRTARSLAVARVRCAAGRR